LEQRVLGDNSVDRQHVKQKPTRSQADLQAGNVREDEKPSETSALLPPAPQNPSGVNKRENHLVHLTWSAIQALLSRPEFKQWSIEKKTIVMLGLASLILVSLNVFFYWSFIQQKETTERVAKSRAILRKLESLFSTVKDAETGQRGYHSAIKKLRPQVEELQTLTRADSKQQQHLSTLNPLITQKLAELQKSINLRQNQGFDAALSEVLTNEGKQLMDRIRDTIHQMQQDKNQQLQTWLKQRQEVAARGQLTFSAGIVLNLVSFYLVYRAIQQEMRERKQAEVLLKQLNEQLEARVQERTVQLKEANAHLLYSNRELEQFAYVASHDLQEPLRAVNSYAQLLARKYQGNLDAKADKYLGYIMEGATRMQQLIDDLLEFSRVGTRGKELKPTACEVVLERVLENLQVAIAQSQAQVTHDPLPIVMGDEIQLIQLLQNLISNAIKFRREELPQVHISAVQRENDWIVSIRDKGIGMESEYFDRIFTIFQRLHSRAEYPGTGIGLAVCKKIVERHGGSIWVESELGVGTTFFFTLPQTSQSTS
jgi:signal transduction histidine kinase